MIPPSRVGSIGADRPQVDEPSTFVKKKKPSKGTSKIVELLNQPDATSGDPPVDVDEPVDITDNDDTPVTGRHHGAKNYTIEELTLLNKCMAAAVPIGPEGVAEALELYSRVAEEKGLAKRNAGALRKKWDKVSTVTRYPILPQLRVISPSQSSRQFARDLGMMK